MKLIHLQLVIYFTSQICPSKSYISTWIIDKNFDPKLFLLCSFFRIIDVSLVKREILTQNLATGIAFFEAIFLCFKSNRKFCLSKLIWIKAMKILDKIRKTKWLLQSSFAPPYVWESPKNVTESKLCFVNDKIMVSMFLLARNVHYHLAFQGICNFSQATQL